ncbi:MAG: HyaD/HybD family hydrogenase maturation endopeptidase [Alphaproteobacteria bacterium]
MTAMVDKGRAGRCGLDALVLGVGNLLWADEGFGVRCAEAFAERFAVPEGTEVMDGGTQGLALVNILSDSRRILIFDACDMGRQPADLILARGADVPRFVAGGKVSLHQTSMMEILALAEFMGGEPPVRMTLIGCQPVELEDYGGGLTPPVAARVDEAVALAAMELERWGVAITERSAAGPCGDGEPIMPAAVARMPYETDRPSAEVACRIGDDRVLARLADRAG